MLTFIIVVVLPVAFLLSYIYRQDSVRPEPKNKLAECFGLGMIGGIVSQGIISIFELIGIGSNYDSMFFGDFLSNLVIAGVAVCIMYFILWKHSEKNSYFDEYIDGPVYAVCVAFGYQTIIDIFNMSTDEWYYVGLLSIITIAALFVAALLIGYYFSMAKFGAVTIDGSYKLKMWAYPTAILCAYNCFTNWFNSFLLGQIIAMVVVVLLAGYVKKQCTNLLLELKNYDSPSDPGDQNTIE